MTDCPPELDVKTLLLKLHTLERGHGELRLGLSTVPEGAAQVGARETVKVLSSIQSCNANNGQA